MLPIGFVVACAWAAYMSFLAHRMLQHSVSVSVLLLTERSETNGPQHVCSGNSSSSERCYMVRTHAQHDMHGTLQEWDSTLQRHVCLLC
jgi:hypothetical protein